jgi:hypothetical protein
LLNWTLKRKTNIEILVVIREPLQKVDVVIAEALGKI